jgi:hypothetical protein
VSVNGTLFEDKMRRFKGECAQFSFNKCLTYTHDGASAKFNTNSHEMDNSASLKIEPLTNSEDCSQSCRKFLFTLPLSLVGRFSPVYIHGRLSEQLSGSQAVFRTTFILKSQAATGYWKDFLVCN